MVAGADPTSHFAFRSYGSEEGLSNLSINAVAQTSDGLLWLGTEDGLFVFDGAHFHELGTAEGLPSSWIFSLLADDRGVWVGTASGVRHVDRDRVDPLIQVREGGEARINALAAGPDHSVWAATDLGLYVIRAGLLAPVPGWTGGATDAVWIDPDGSVLAGRGTDLVRRAPTGRWTATTLGPDRITQIARTPDGALWVRSARKLWTCTGAADALACRDISNELPEVGEVGRMLVDHRGSLWVATRRGLAHRIGAERWEILGAAQGLPARSVLSAFEDREGSLWIIADQLYQQLGHGLLRAYSAETGLPGDTVWAIDRDSHGELVLGTNAGVVESHAGAWQIFPGTEESSIAAIADAGSIVFAAGHEARLFGLDRDKRTVTPIAKVPSDAIVSLALDGADLWIATGKAGLWKLTGAATPQPILRREELPEGAPREDIFQVVRDPRGWIWAGGSDGLALRRGGRWRRYTERDGLVATASTYVLARASGETCMAYVEAHGVTCFRVADDGSLVGIHTFTQATGLTSDTVYVLGEDAAGRLYVGTGIGVDIIDGAEIVHVSKADGLVGDDCAAGSFHADPDGTVMIGTTRGVARFESARFRSASVPPAPVLMSVDLDGTRVRASSSSVEAPHTGATSVAINFATPTFMNRERLEYQVRLSPLEDAWHVASVDEARYPQLAPGHYRFEVRSRRVPDEFGPTTAIDLVIPPAWWQTWWLRVLFILALVVAAALVIAWRTRVSAARAQIRIVARSEASFRALIVQSPDCVLVHRDGAVVYANPRAVQLLGYGSEQELVGLALRALVAEDFDPAILADVSAAPSDATLAREIRMRGANGVAPVLEVTSLQVDFDGVPAVLTMGRDVTARKALEARLMFTDRMASIGTLAAGIAHEINNPLAYVMTNIEVLREELGETAAPELLEALGDASEGAKRIQSIVRGVKTFSRSDDDSSTPTDVHRAIESALRLAATELRHRCVIVKELGKVPAVLGNEARLGQVFINLLVNAAQAMPERELEANQIRVTTRTGADGAAVVEIADNGHGMTPQVARRIFEPFFTTKDVGQGTGLGLAVCHGIVERFGGRISVDSTVGVGTTFRVTLPAAPAHLAALLPPAPARAAVDQGACLRLLLID
ncbi:MAG TPA: two-component regulator propeller domain-containing protein, partial [Kofleriaceae bacterium]